MNNRDFHELLRQRKDARGLPVWNVRRVAEAIYCNYEYVVDVLNNKSEQGGRVRAKLVRFFKKEFVTWPAILAALGWDEEGNKHQTNTQSSHI